MTIANSTDPTVVRAELLYSDPPTDGSRAMYKINSNAKGGHDENIVPVKQEVSIENVRGQEHLYSLDKTGFQFNVAPTKLKDSNFRDDKKVREEYYPESIKIIKKITGASRVVLFDHTHRQRRPENEADTPETRRPAAQVHIDQTAKSSIARVHRHLSADEVPELLKHRFQIINLWRPIKNALDKPLALCDYRSFDPKADQFPVSLIYPDYEGETMAVRYNPNHKWKYLRGMSSDEIVLIKCFDSIQDGSVAIYTPHTAFDDPTTPEGTPSRESIEVRALIFYD